MSNCTVKCDNCYSINHLKTQPTDFAFECYNCGFRFWLDNDAKDEFMMLTDVSDEEAEQQLKDGVDWLNFAMGYIDD